MPGAAACGNLLFPVVAGTVCRGRVLPGDMGEEEREEAAADGRCDCRWCCD